MIERCCVGMILLLNGCLVTSPPPPTAQEQIEWGSRFASPGARLIYEESSRVRSEKGVGIIYTLRAGGLPKEKTYSSWNRVFGSTIEVYKPLHIDGSGQIAREEGGEAQMILWPLTGELIEHALISSDRTAKAFAEITPLPLESRGTGKCRLSAKLEGINALKKPELYLVIGQGFKPKREIQVVTTYNEEPFNRTVPGTDDGRFNTLLVLGTEGIPGGGLSVTATDTLCSVTLVFR